jgi:acyl carrier protein
MNEQQLKKCFIEALGVTEDAVTDGLTYNSTKQWDSVGHMLLVAALETEFNVMLDTDDIISMNSVAVVRQVLTKHGVPFA